MSTQYLSELVGTLCPTEKKFITSALLARKGDSKMYVKYFKNLTSGSPWDNETAAKKLDISLNNVSVLKSRLSVVILETLVGFKTKRCTSISLRNQISEIEVLLEKQLYRIAYRQCESALKKAQHSENTYLISELNQLKIQAGLYAKRIGVKEFENESQNFKQSIDVLYQNAKANIGRIGFNFKDKEQFQSLENEFTAWMKNYQLQKKKGNLGLAFNFLSNISVFFHRENKPEKRLEIVKDYLAEFSGNDYLKQLNPASYLCALNTAFLSAWEVEEEETINWCIDELEGFGEIDFSNSKIRTSINYINLHCSLCNYYISIDRSEIAEGRLDELSRQFEMVKEYLDPKSEIMLRFSIAQIELDLNKLKKALSSVNRILREQNLFAFLKSPSIINHVSMETLLAFRALVLSLLLDEDVDYFVPAYQNEVEKERPISGLEKMFVNYCKATFDAEKQERIAETILVKYGGETESELKNPTLAWFKQMIIKQFSIV